MPTNRQFSLALEALAERKWGTTSALQSRPISAPPNLSGVLAELGPIPREALFLGIASDGLPVLLNLHDPLPGPMLVIGDADSGKTAFLQSVARSVIQTHSQDDVQFGVITNQPDEWDAVENTPHRVGIFDVKHTSAQDLITSLASWAHSNKNARQSVLLLIDDLESIAKTDLEALQNFRWLLLRGPARRVWPTLATGVVSTCIAYLSFLYSGVAGLAQLACFTIAGLAVAGVRRVEADLEAERLVL